MGGRLFSTGRSGSLVLIAVVGLAVPRAGIAQMDVLTRAYDNSRSGANLNETALTASNVKLATFGKLFTLTVDDQVYAQPLYVANLSIAGGTHNVVFIATVNNTVYAFDADHAGVGNPVALWQKNFNGAFRAPNHTEVGQACGTYNDLSGNIGIIGTPVIAGGTQTLFVVTRTVESASFRQRLRALDITTGNERVAAVTIGTINAQTNHQHPALALSAGKIYVAWASHCDTNPYHGRVMAFDASNLSQAASFDVVPTGTQAGIWMAGAGPVIDASGNLFYATGNGTFDGVNNFGESILKLGSGTLMRLEFFTPSNFSQLNGIDRDLGSSGPIQVPGTTLIVMGGKGGDCDPAPGHPTSCGQAGFLAEKGVCFLVNMNGMGGISTGDPQIPQKWHCVDPDNVRSGLSHHLHNAMVAWNSPAGVNLYTWGENDFGHAWRFNGATFNTPAVSVSSVLPPVGMPGGMMALSASGSTTGTGVLWVTMPLSGDANQATVPGVFRAFNAENLAQEIWNSATLVPDNAMNFTKGSQPLVVNGKVYVPSLSNRVSVYGLTSSTEAEAATILGFTSGRTVRVFSDVPASGGQGLIMESHAAGDFLSFTINVAQAGNYGVRIRNQLGNNRGIWQLSIDGANQGATQNGFGTTAYPEADLGMTNLTAGSHTFRFQITGKTSRSKDFWISLDYLKLAPR
jgi:hypothetical protein